MIIDGLIAGDGVEGSGLCVPEPFNRLEIIIIIIIIMIMIIINY